MSIISRSSVAILAGGLTLIGCVPPTARMPEPTPKALNFSYAPPNSAPAGSARVTLALINPQWANKGDDLLELSTAMRNDFMALLTARGYTTRGPFDSYQAMVYPDKTGSDLVLTPELEIEWKFDELTPTTAGGLLGALMPGASSTSINGTATVRGRVNLVLSESMTNERMWSKSIAVAPISAHWTGRKRYNQATDGVLNSTETIWHFVTTDPGFREAMNPKLEAMYQAVLQKGWDYLDPRELAMVKQQAQELRKRKVY